jgi:alkanesulfonate monooxygenase SsuD/methylene tetrahydromethanopterin reductase-like flavin-dependent oxidoreductase (luciferase family)
MSVVAPSVPGMRYGVSLPNFGVGLDARRVADWARAAEAAGWDGFFLWDHLFAFAPGPIDAVDPWIALAAAACATSRIRLGTLVTPLPRRRPVVVARQTVTLDRLSSGRLVLGVGIGAFPHEWEYCGEEPDAKVRAAMLDEHLDLLSRLWTGEPVTHQGSYYRLAGPDFAAVCHPPPQQRPRVPVWVGGTWPGIGPFRRAARWDGVFPMRADQPWTVQDTREVRAAVLAARSSDTEFDLAVPGDTDPGDDGRHAEREAHATAGATWWIEGVHPWRYGWSGRPGQPWPAAAMLERISAGP